MHDCIIGLLHHSEYSELVTLDQLKAHIEDQQATNDLLAADPVLSRVRSLRANVFTLRQYADGRRSTDLTRFVYCPDCGKRIDWGAIKRETARPPP